LFLFTVMIVCCGVAVTAGEQAERDAATAERTDGQTAENDSNGSDDSNDSNGSEDKREPKLSFTDDDLKKYQRPKAKDENDAAVLEGIDEQEKGTPPPVPQGAPLVRTPLAIAKPPAADPLKEFKDREARDKFRAQQVETLRDRIAGLEKRLAYLQQKRLAIIDPLRIMPQPQGSDNTAEEAALGSGELLAAVEEEIESTEASLNSAQDSLVTLQTRFGAEAR
jgi:hypothetical protein